MAKEHPDDTPEMVEMRKCADVLCFGHLMAPPPPPLVKVAIPDAPKRSTTAPALFDRITVVAVPHLTYVIRSGQFVKIGATADVERRVRELMISNPHEVEAIAVLAGGRTLEGILHRRFKAHRFRHEWFRIEGALAEWIEKGCPMEDRDG